MKKSNKFLIGGFFSPIVILIATIIILTISSTDDSEYQFKNNQNIDWTINNSWHFNE